MRETRSDDAGRRVVVERQAEALEQMLDRVTPLAFDDGDGEATDNEWGGDDADADAPSTGRRVDGDDAATDAYAPDVADLRDFFDSPGTPLLKVKGGAVAKYKRVKRPTTGTKQNKAHVKKRKFLRLALALVVQGDRDEEDANAIHLTTRPIVTGGAKRTKEQFACNPFKPIESMTNKELTLWMRTLFPELPPPQGRNGQEARPNWWSQVLREDAFDGFARFFGLGLADALQLVFSAQVSGKGLKETFRWKLNRTKLDSLLAHSAEFRRRYRQAYAGYHEKALRCDFLSNDLAMAAFAARFNEVTSAAPAAASPAPAAAATGAADDDADAFSSPGGRAAVEAMMEVDAGVVMERAARTYDAVPAAVECGGGAALCGGWDAGFIASLQRWEQQQQLTPTS